LFEDRRVGIREPGTLFIQEVPLGKNSLGIDLLRTGPLLGFIGDQRGESSERGDLGGNAPFGGGRRAGPLHKATSKL